MTSRNIVIVDGYSTARELVREINLHGGVCFHVRSVEKPPARLAAAFDASPYKEDLGYCGSIEEAAEKLKPYNIQAVVAGSEPGVEYAEALAHHMGFPTNDPALAKARRNKYDMAKAVERAGLAGARQEKVSSGDEAVAWAASQGTWPIVVKPVESAGSDGVVVCNSLDEVKKAADSALNQNNLLGIDNSAVLVQTYIDGDQYFVNTISIAGAHTVTDAWRMTLRPIPGFSNAMEEWFLLDPEEADAKSLIAYTKQVLDAIGVINGPAVSEVRLSSNGPALIETGARLNGPTMERDPYISAGLQGTQATALAQQLVAPDMFAANWLSKGGYSRAKQFATSFFIFKGKGVVQSTDGLETLKELKSYHSNYRPLKAGDDVTLTTDTVGRGGVVYWLADDPAQLQEDVETFRALDDKGSLYEVAYS